jgi:hypothetical protein
MINKITSKLPFTRLSSDGGMLLPSFRKMIAEIAHNMAENKAANPPISNGEILIGLIKF